MAKMPVLHQSVQTENEPVRLHHPKAEGTPPHELGELVRCPCGNDRWNLELIGAKFTDKDGYSSQNAKYTCSECDRSVQDTV